MKIRACVFFLSLACINFIYGAKRSAEEFFESSSESNKEQIPPTKRLCLENCPDVGTLHNDIRSRKIDSIRVLLKRNIELANKPDSDGTSPLFQAILPLLGQDLCDPYEDLLIITALIQNGAKFAKLTESISLDEAFVRNSADYSTKLAKALRILQQLPVKIFDQ